MARTLQEERDRSRSLATSIVSFAIMGVGVAFLVLSVLLVVRGGLGFLFLSILLGGIGAAALVGGFFFHLVPSRIEELAEEKREYDRRQREEEQAKRERLGQQ